MCSLLCALTFTSFHSPIFLLVPFPCFVVLFHSCCAHVQVLGTTLLHEWHIFCSHTELNLQLTLGEGFTELEILRYLTNPTQLTSVY